MFAGIGGFRAGLTRAGGFQCVGHCEIDKYADASYRAIHDIGEEEVYYSDAREIDPRTMPDFDLLCAGFPCQPYRLSAEKGEASRTPEEPCSLKLPDWLKPESLHFYVLKMFPACCHMTKAGRFTPSSPRFMNWGMVWNGLCATAQTTELLKQGEGCSLSGILIPDAPEKYFLSPKMMARLLYNSSEGRRDTGSTTSEESPALKPQGLAALEPKPGCI